MNSVYITSAPFSLHKALNGGSLTSSIGANSSGKSPVSISPIFTTLQEFYLCKLKKFMAGNNRGILAPSSLGVKLSSLLLLVLVGAILFTALGMGIAASAYGLDYAQIETALTDMQSPNAAEVLRLVQGFATIGTFLVPALVAAFLFSPQPQAFLRVSSYPKPAVLATGLLVVISFAGGFLSDFLYQLSVSIPWPESWGNVEQYILESQAEMNERYRFFLDMPNFLVFTRVLVVMALLPAVAEEALFRGVLQPLLRQKMGLHASVWLTALAFALLHQQALAFLSILVLGAVLGYLKAWSGSLWVSTLAHFINNGSIVVWVYFSGGSYLEESEPSSLLYSGLMLATLAVSLGAFKKWVHPTN
jgi:membrane protease YdiL (CAAX protease family)